MTHTEIYDNGDGQLVRLPAGFEFSESVVTIRREGNAVILEPLKNEKWPTGFFDRIRIDDASFRRPEQGDVPPPPDLDRE